jgi:hypothetical protein
MAAVPKRPRGSLLLAMSITVLWVAGMAYAQAVLTAPGRYVIVVTQEVPNVLRTGQALQLEECVSIERIRDGTAFRARYPYPLSTCPVVDTNFDGEYLTYRIVCPTGSRGEAKFIATRSGYVGTITLHLGTTIIERHSARRVGECDPTIQFPDRLPPEDYYRRSWPSPGTPEADR